MPYAETTKVPVYKTKVEIEKLVKKRGADAFAVMESDGQVKVAFRMEGRNILFRMSIPEKAQEERSIWRAMLLTIKGKIESAERGIETFEEAFLANIVMPNGQTVADSTIPAIENHYQGRTDIPLLPSS